MNILVKALLLAPLTACASYEIPATPLNPPYDFPTGGGPVSRISFTDSGTPSEVELYTVAVFEDAKTCSKRHNLNMQITNTLTIPANKEFSFVVAYQGTNFPVIATCAAAFTLVPDGSSYVVSSRADPTTKTCRFFVGKQTESGIVEADHLTQRIVKVPFRDGWCK
jgi:hypothetical protein